MPRAETKVGTATVVALLQRCEQADKQRAKKQRGQSTSRRARTAPVKETLSFFLVTGVCITASEMEGHTAAASSIHRAHSSMKFCFLSSELSRSESIRALMMH